MIFDFTTFLFYAIPIAAIVFFIVSIILYFSAKNKNKQTPDSYSESQMKNRKTLLTISSVIAGVLAAVVIGLALLTFLFANYM